MRQQLAFLEISPRTVRDDCFAKAWPSRRAERVVSNPLATTIRFAHANRGDGQIKARYLNVVNLRVGRLFNFGKRKLDVSFDIFNLLNAHPDQQFFDGGNQLYRSNYAMKDGEFFSVNRQPPRQAQVTMRGAF